MKKAAAAVMALRGCLLAIQKYFEQMASSAYIMVVMQGCSFCTGAKEGR